MDKQNAKRLACREAALILDAELTSGWSARLDLPVQDRRRAGEAMGEIVAELIRRSGPLGSLDTDLTDPFGSEEAT